MTAKQIKIEKRNELLKAFNPNATNTETLSGLGVTFNKKTIRIVTTEGTIERKIQQLLVNNQCINYIIITTEINKIKKELGLTQNNIAKMFGYKDGGSYARSTRKHHIDNGICEIYKLIKVLSEPQ